MLYKNCQSVLDGPFFFSVSRSRPILAVGGPCIEAQTDKMSLGTSDILLFSLSSYNPSISPFAMGKTVSPKVKSATKAKSTSQPNAKMETLKKSRSKAAPIPEVRYHLT